LARHYVSSRFPNNPVELARCLADPVQAAEQFGGSEQSWRDFGAHYADASPDIARMVAEREQLAVQDALRSGTVPRAVAGEAVQGRTRNKLYNRKAPGVAVDGVLPASDTPLADFFSIADPRNDLPDAVAGRGRIQNAMSERIPSEGGFLVPEILRSDLLAMTLEKAIIRPRARIIPMDSLRVPYPTIDDTSHQTNVFGGVTGYWTEEGAALQASAPSFARAVLEAKKLTIYTTIPNELLQDSPELVQAFLENTLPAAIAWFEDVAFIGGQAGTGTGVGEPQGFINAPAAIKVGTAANNVIRFDDLAKAFARILPQSLTSPSLVWLCSPDAKQQLLEMAVTPLTATSSPQPVAPPAWLTGMQAIDKMPSTLFGIPLIVSEKMPSAASSNTTTAGALSLVDLDYYLIGDRMSLQVAMSDQYLFANDLVAYRLIDRLDGRIWLQSALTPANSGVTLSPVVLVDTTT
jgi:HK97 family phage major capsid protein